MQKVLVMPDSFKGTASSKEICSIIKERINFHFSSCEVVTITVADGGEGSVDCFLESCGGEKIDCNVTGPFFEKCTAFYGLIDGGKTAVIEMAACAGLPLAGDRKNPAITTTLGVGELILDATARGAEKIILGLGGSATNDCGCGMAAALGVKFFDEENRKFIPTGGTLLNVRKIDLSGISDKLGNVKIVAMCDVENPLYGNEGAAHIFARQKGADDNMITQLDKGLMHIAEIIKRDAGVDVSKVRGGGAAGGMGAGVYAFFGGELIKGIDVVLDTVNFDEKIKNTDMVFTGEGRFDNQSLMGKVIDGISERAKKANVPVIVIAGGAVDGECDFEKAGVSAVFSINRLPEDFEISKHKTKENLKNTVDNILRLIKSVVK